MLKLFEVCCANSTAVACKLSTLFYLGGDFSFPKTDIIGFMDPRVIDLLKLLAKLEDYCLLYSFPSTWEFIFCMELRRFEI
jgi:hypothetical protein